MGATVAGGVSNTPIYDDSGVRIVELNRLPHSGLGISIVGGKISAEGLGIKGIFIRHVLETSPAGRLGTLKTGDQVLEVVFFLLLLSEGSG